VLTLFGSAFQDDLLLLKKGGQVVYHGPLGNNCSALVSYFELRGVPKISLGENPANWMLRVITDEGRADLAEEYLKSEEYANLKAELDKIKESSEEDLKIVYENEFATPFGKRRELVNRRLQLIYWRSPTYNLARVMVSLVIAFILGSVFIFKRDLEVFTEVDMQARLSVVFISFIITGIMAILSVLPVMTKIRDMYYRHRDAGMYDSYSIGLALGVAEKYFILLSTALFCVVFLSTSGLGNGVYGLIGFWVRLRCKFHCRALLFDTS
jgi:ABC-type multidrug transport system fused ATPase/permease subunit